MALPLEQIAETQSVSRLMSLGPHFLQQAELQSLS